MPSDRRRLPVVLSSDVAPADDPMPYSASTQDEIIKDYLDDILDKQNHKGEVFYHADGTRLFCAGRPTQLFRLRFIDPVPELQGKLTKEQRRYFLPENIKEKEVLNLIQRHIDTKMAALSA